MKIIKNILILTFALSLMVMAGCSKQEINSGTKSSENVENEVNVYMWGGSESINRYMDDFVAVNLEKYEGIKLNC